MFVLTVPVISTLPVTSPSKLSIADAKFDLGSNEVPYFTSTLSLFNVIAGPAISATFTS